MRSIDTRREDTGHKFYNHASEIIHNPRRGADFHGGVPFIIREADFIKGLRVCMIRVNVGFDGDRLLKKLTRSALPHLVPWECAHEPTAYPDGRFIVIEAQWPPDEGLEHDDIQLKNIRSAGLGGNVIVIGQNQVGMTICLPSSEIEHILIAGQTGAGKSFTMRSMGAQLSKQRRREDELPNQIVLVDGKRGGGLGIINGLPGQVGPIAVETPDAIDALGWCVDEMNRRYDTKSQIGGGKLDGIVSDLFVLIDEPQVWTADSINPIITALVNRLATQGRGAKVHLIAGTQKPMVSVFGKGGVGSTSKDQFSAIIGQRVGSADTSRVVMGASVPRCDLLLDKGDSHVVVTTPDEVRERVQVAYVSEADLQRLAGGKPTLDEWPEFDASSLGNGHAKNGRPGKTTTAQEWAIGLETVAKGSGRPWYREQFEKPPGSSRARAILTKCKEIVRIMGERGVGING